MPPSLADHPINRERFFNGWCSPDIYGGWKPGEAAADFDIISTSTAPSDIKPSHSLFGLAGAYGNDPVTGPMFFLLVLAQVLCVLAMSYSTRADMDSGAANKG
jgi:hypothetical protein